MSDEIKIDGYCAWHPEHGWCNGTCAEYEADCKDTHDFLNLDLEGGWQIKPICLIDSQKLQRLRKIEEWAKEAYAIIAGEWSFSKFLEEYDAIITEAKHDKD